MVTPSAPAGTAGAGVASVVKTPIAVLIISCVELALGVLGVGFILEAQAWRSDLGIDYVMRFGYASSGALLVTLGLLAVALLSSPNTRLRRLFRTHIVFGGVAAAAAIGNALVAQVHAWTTPFTCDGCDLSYSVGPTVNQIVASVALDLGAGAAAVLLPAIALLLMRNRREAAQLN